jgi:hypothetical protein
MYYVIGELQMKDKQKIDIVNLREMIKTEINVLNEQLDHNGIRDVVTHASKFLAELEKFQDNATGTMLNAVTPQITKLAVTLEDMVSTPGSYVDQPKRVQQRVSLKPAKKNKK